MKKIVISTIAAAVAVWAMDFVIHGMLLMPLYQQTESMWRPMAQMNMTLNLAVTVVLSLLFVLFYDQTVSGKNLQSGLRFGAWYGALAGVSMGIGSYVYLPIPKALALGWLVGTFVEMVVVGAIVGQLSKD